MPLLDHFHHPLSAGRRWESFHSLWCGTLLARLTRLLPPPRFFGEVNVHLGARVAADVAEFDTGVFATGEGNGVAVATWAPPVAAGTIDAIFPDDIEVQIIDTRDGATLIAVIELVSPANKDREDARDGFAAKCAAYLQRGVGVAVVDVVTSRHSNLHNSLMHLLDQTSMLMEEETHTYASSYRPYQRDGRDRIDIWLAPLVPGQPLPTLPLALRGVGFVPLELEASYAAAREIASI